MGMFKGPGKRIEELEVELARIALVMHHQGEQLQHVNELAHATLGKIQTWGEDEGARVVRSALTSIADASR